MVGMQARGKLCIDFYAREGICDSMGVLYAKNALSPADSGAGRVADDACERRHRR
jgi:hypothetical protein